MKKFVIVTAALVVLCLGWDAAYYRLGWYVDLHPDEEVASLMEVRGEEIIHWTEDGPQPFEIRGVNMGSGIPGEWSTDFAIDKETYLRWFGQIQAMGANVVRVYTINCDLVLQALRQVDGSGRFHHGKLLTDGLLTFSGDRQELTRMLWDSFDAVSLSMQTVILDYIRFSGSRMDEELLPLLAEEGRDDELRFSCIRYFEKHLDPRAYPLLLSFLEHPGERRWEYAAISAAALSAYPGERTVLALKWAMGSASWYIRLNAARSLTSFHLTYQNLGDVMDSGDRYAREILQYRLDLQQAQQAPKEQERQEVALV